MNHKRKKPKVSRAGCLLCKSNKIHGRNKHGTLGHVSWGKLRDEAHARSDLAGRA